MGVIIPEGYAKVDFKFTLLGRTEPFIISMGASPELVTLSLSEAFAALNANVQVAGHLAGANGMIGYYTYNGMDVTYMSDTGPVLYPKFALLTGTKTGNAPPPQVAVVMRKQTARGGRKGRGRMFLHAGYVREEDIDPSGIIDGTVATAIQNRVITLFDDFEDAELLPVLLHSGTEIPDLITGFTIDTLVATQRRRLGR